MNDKFVDNFDDLVFREVFKRLVYEVVILLEISHNPCIR